MAGAFFIEYIFSWKNLRGHAPGRRNLDFPVRDGRRHFSSPRFLRAGQYRGRYFS
jgi:hypothetical protein